jgi:hypothetical protein
MVLFSFFNETLLKLAAAAATAATVD